MLGTKETSAAQVRLPRELKDWLRDIATQNRRTMNGELVKRLEDSRAREQQEAAKA